MNEGRDYYMKKVIVGTGIFICGVIVLCSNHIIQSIISAMPNTTLASGGMMGFLSYILMAIGAGIVLYGCIKDKEE